MWIDGLHSEHGRELESGRISETQDHNHGTRGTEQTGEGIVLGKTWFKAVEPGSGPSDQPVIECKDGFCPMPQPKVDMVNHPPHYSNSKKKIETIDKIEDAVQFAPDAVLGGLQWQVIKYIDRLWDKENPKQDAMKARWYLDRLIQKLED